MRKDILASSIGTAGTAAALMFFLDPKRGSRRRALVRDKMSHLAKDTGRSLSKAGRDLGNRTRGVAAETWSWARPHQAAEDEVLEERVRSKIGRCVSQPNAIEVSARNGMIILRGDIVESEVRKLMSSAYSVRDVKGVRNEMRTHNNESEIPGFPIARHGGNGGFLKRAQVPGVRLALGAAGGALTAIGSLYRARRTHPVLGKVLSSAGVGLLGTELMNTGVSQLTHARR